MNKNAIKIMNILQADVPSEIRDLFISNDASRDLQPDRAESHHSRVNHLRFESLRNIVALNERGIKIGDQVMDARGRRGFLAFSDPSLRIKFLDAFDNDVTCYDVETIKKIKA